MTGDSQLNQQKINRLYKNLEYISRAYFSTESLFHGWEAIYALVIGQLFIAFFTKEETMMHQRLIIASVGFMFCFIWFILSSVSWQLSTYRFNVMKLLQKGIRDEYKDTYEFFPESPLLGIEDIDCSYQLQNKIRCFDIKLRNVFDGLFSRKALKATWFYRRVLPFILAIFWSYLAIQAYKDP